MVAGETGKGRREGGRRHYGCCSGDNRHMSHIDCVLFPLWPPASSDCANDDQRGIKRVRPEFLL